VTGQEVTVKNELITSKQTSRYLRGVATTAFLLGMSLHAQVAPPPAAPLPALLSNTQIVFIGNAGDQENADALRAYNAFYAGIDALHRFKLVNDPAQADMIVELHYEIDLGGSKVSGGNSARQFRAVLIDASTHTLVWSLTERTNYAALQKNRDKNLDAAMAALVADFTSLVSTQPVPPNNKSKVHHD
jgi:hypothetical protein